jgi:hypothetical protein
VEREYLDDELRRLASEPEFRPAGWSGQEIREFRRLVQSARAAYVADDLRNMRLLRIEPGDSDDPTRAWATLSSGRVIDLTFKNLESHGAVVFEVLTAEMEPQR